MDQVKSYVQLTIIGIVVFIVVYFIGRSYGKNLPPPAVPDPGDIQADPKQATFDPTNLVERLGDNISGWTNPLTRDMTPWIELNSLSDSAFVAVMNAFDKKYYGTWRQTLYQAYMDEKFNPFSASDLLSSLSERFERLEKTRKK